MSDRKQTPKTQSVASDQALPPIDPRLLAAMYGQPCEEEEIDLLEYWRVIWGRKKMILAVSFAAALLAIVISLLMPNIYKAQVLLTPVGSGKSKGGGLSAALGGLGGLASVAGISLGGGGGSTAENLAVLNSREFIWKFVKENKLMPVLFADDWDAKSKKWKKDDPKKQPTLWDAYRMFTKGGLMNVDKNKKTGLVTVSVEWKDPVLAAKWANALVRRLNAYLRRKAIARSEANLTYLNKELARTRVADMRQTLFKLISQEEKKAMLASTQEQFAFRVLDTAVPPDKKAKPKRSLIVILSTFVAGFLAVIVAFIQESVQRRRQDTEKALQGGGIKE